VTSPVRDVTYFRLWGAQTEFGCPFWAFGGRAGLHGYPRLDDAPEGRFCPNGVYSGGLRAETFQASDVLKSIVAYTSRKRRHRLARGGVWKVVGARATS
jgi:hypothetical protein